MGAPSGEVGDPAGFVCLNSAGWAAARRSHLLTLDICPGAGAGAGQSLQLSGHKICKLQNMETLSSAKPMKPHFPITEASPFCRLPTCNGLL